MPLMPLIRSPIKTRSRVDAAEDHDRRGGVRPRGAHQALLLSARFSLSGPPSPLLAAKLREDVCRKYVGKTKYK